MYRPKSVAKLISDRNKGDYSDDSVENEFPRFKREKSKRSKTQWGTLQKIYNRLGAQWKRFDQIEKSLTQLEEVKKIVIDILDQSSKCSELKPNETKLKYKKHFQPDCGVTSHSEDAIVNDGPEENSLTNKSKKTSKSNKKLQIRSSKSKAKNAACVSQVSETKPNDTFPSYLKMIETDCVKLKCILEEGMIPNTKSVINYILYQPIKDVILKDKNGYKETSITNELETALKLYENVTNDTKTPTGPKGEGENRSQSANNTTTFQITNIVPNGTGSLEIIPWEPIAVPKNEEKNKKDSKGVDVTLDFPMAHEAKGSDSGWKEVQGTERINNGLPYYVATKELEAGHHIFTKKPLLTFPKNIDQHDMFAIGLTFSQLIPYLSTQGWNYSSCVVCFEFMVFGEIMEDPLHGIRLGKCPSCGWPVHSPRDGNLQKVKNNSCQEEHEKECKIFIDNGMTGDKVRGMKGFSWLCLAALRAVINPIIGRKLLKLPFCPLPPVLCHQVAYKFVREGCKQCQVSGEALVKIILVIVSNYLPSSAGYNSIRKKFTHTIYEGGHTGRILPHDCNPNCSLHVNPRTGEATFKTRRKVKLDEMLTINYFVDGFPQPINERAQFLLRMYASSNQLEYCNCGKCKDGKDFTSAMKRLKGAKDHKKGCRSQYLMPYSTRLQESQQSMSTSNQSNADKQDQANPDLDDLYFWQCESCKSLGSRIQQIVIQEKVERIRQEVKNAFFGHNYTELKEIIKKYSDVELHPDHSLMLLAQVTLSYLVVEAMRVRIFNREKMRLDLHKHFILDLDKAIKMLKRSDNGRSETYGTLLYYHTLLSILQLGEKMSTKKIKTNSSEVQIALEFIKNNLKESWEIMMNDPFLSALEINRRIYLFDLYSKEIEIKFRRNKGLAESSQESIFETFRTIQKESLGTELISSQRGSLYLYEFKLEGSQDSSNKTETNVTECGGDEEGNMVKIEFKAQPNNVSGPFMRELLLLVD